jgi:hypothetical protein
VSGATGYNVQYKTAANAAFTTVSSATNTLNLSGLSANTAYNYQIQTLRYLYIMSYIYKHIRPDTNKVFYIGVGSDERRIDSNQSRNKFWKNMVKLKLSPLKQKLKITK